MLVVNDDEIGNGIEDFQPLTTRLSDPGEEPGVFQGHGSVNDQRLQQVEIAGREFMTHVRQRKNAQQVGISPLQTDQSRVLPSQSRSQFASENLNAAAGDLGIPVMFAKFGK